MKDKPTKWGIKVFVLADARNGYTTHLQIYTGTILTWQVAILDYVLGCSAGIAEWAGSEMSKSIIYGLLL